MARRRDDPQLVSLAVRLGVNAIALWAASDLVRGFDIHGWPSLIATAAIFGVVNALITPVVKLIGCPLTFLTLGLFLLLINAAMLALTVWIAKAFDLDVTVDGFVAAFLAALIVTIVSWFVSTFIGTPIRRVLR